MISIIYSIANSLQGDFRTTSKLREWEAINRSENDKAPPLLEMYCNWGWGWLSSSGTIEFMAPAELFQWEASLDHIADFGMTQPESLPNIADSYFNVDITHQESLQTIGMSFFNIEVNGHNIWQAAQVVGSRFIKEGCSGNRV